MSDCRLCGPKGVTGSDENNAINHFQGWHRDVSWRSHDRRPDVIEIGIPLIMFAAVFEVILPSTAMFRNKAIADPYDVQCYVLGAIVANGLWQRMYDRGNAVPSPSTCAEPE